MAYLSVGAVAWLAVLLFFRTHRIWPLYSVWGAVGLTFLLILGLRGSAAEHSTEQLAAALLHAGLSRMGIETHIFDRAAGTVLIFLEMENSWAATNIDIECSGVLESCVFLGLLLFYPAFTLKQKIFYCVAGVTSIFIINLLRLYTIIFLVAIFGRQAIYVAHTIAGRLLFFLLVTALYWSVFSRPTLNALRRRLHG